MHYAEASTDLLHFDSLTAESLLHSSTEKDLQRLHRLSSSNRFNSRRKAGEKEDGGSESGGGGGTHWNSQNHEKKKLKPHIQSQTGSVIIDVGGIAHHVKVKNFTQQVSETRTKSFIVFEP